MSDKLETSKSSGPHLFLSQLEGEWEGHTSVWFEPDKVVDRSPVQGKMKLTLDGRFILHEYTGSFQGKALEGIALYGYHLDLDIYQSAWVDSFHCGSSIMFSESSTGQKDFNVQGSYYWVTPEQTQKWGWRTEIRMTHENEIVITAYNVFPEGSEAKATETVYTRVAPAT